MNAVSPIQPAGPALAAHLDVRAMMRTLLAPFRVARSLDQQPLGELYVRADGALWMDHRREYRILDDVRSGGDRRERARATALALHPDLSAALPAIDEARLALHKALTEPAPEIEARLLISAMLDGFRTKPNEGAATYADALMFTLEEFETVPKGEFDERRRRIISSSVMAAAVRKVWREQTFAPSIFEFCTACEDAHTYLRRAAHRAVKLSDAHDVVEDVLIETGDLKPPVPVGDLDDDIPF